MTVAFTRTSVLAALLTASLAGCIASLGPRDADDRMRDLVAARARWNQFGASNYTMDVQLLCFCPTEGVATVTVAGGRVTSVIVKDTGRPVNAFMLNAYRTVEGLFDQLEDAIERDAHRLEAEYDAHAGFPLRFYIDYSANVADEESGIEIRGLSLMGR
jgi:hypothetical protein